MQGKGLPLVFRAWKPGDPLNAGVWGIQEPLPSAPALDPDILLVPLLAFDTRGYRLGYGGGFYDRTLAGFRMRKRVVAIGVAFDEQRIDAVPHTDYDQRLDWVLTPSGPIASSVAEVVRTFRSAVPGRPEGLHYTRLGAAASSRAPSAAKAGVGPFHRKSSIDSNSAMSVRSVARSRNSNARSRSRASVRASAPALRRVHAPRRASRRESPRDGRYLASTAAADFAPQPGRPG